MFPVTYIAGETVILQGKNKNKPMLLIHLWFFFPAANANANACFFVIPGDEGDNFYVIDQGEVDVSVCPMCLILGMWEIWHVSVSALSAFDFIFFNSVRSSPRYMWTMTWWPVSGKEEASASWPWYTAPQGQPQLEPRPMSSCGASTGTVTGEYSW